MASHARITGLGSCSPSSAVRRQGQEAHGMKEFRHPEAIQKEVVFMITLQCDGSSVEIRARYLSNRHAYIK